MTFPDPRFYHSRGPLTGEEAATIAGASAVRGGHERFSTVASASRGGEDAIVFAEKSAEGLPPAKAIIVGEGKAEALGDGPAIVLEARSPKLAFAAIARHLFASRSEEDADGAPKTPPVVDASAFVHPTAVVGEGARIGPNCFVSANAVIGAGVVLGEGTWIGPAASVTHAILGRHCRVLAGARVGEAGFGYTPGPSGAVHMPQLGRVIFGDEVDFGANSTIDRGALGDTELGAGCKIDNLCQIGHNCRLGRGVIVASQTGISGSCEIGDFVMMGGQVGMADHLRIGDGALLAARAGVMRDVESRAKVGGYPARPLRQWMKEMSALKKLAEGKAGGSE
jgi:UDP-3-O-[3-hydroxymyristoyl] glucosamine N-acyltransferase